MRHLRAYLIVRSPSLNYEITVHRDFESLTDAWNLQQINSDTSALVHIGFWRPEIDKIDSLLSKYTGALLLAASARYAFNPHANVASTPVGELDGMPIYIALSGWGYEIDAKSLNLETKSSSDCPKLMAINNDWVSEIAITDNELANDAFQAGIIDETSYINSEAELSPSLRIKLANIRYKHLCGESPSELNILDFLKFSPPWLLNMKVTALNLSTRAINIFQEKEIVYISDLSKYKSAMIFKFPRFGQNTYDNITTELIKLFKFGPLTQPTKSTLINLDTTLHNTQIPNSLIETFSSAFAVLKNTEAAVIKARMGLTSPPKTLQEIADSTTPSITRERVRQIESKGIRRIKSIPYWDGLVENRLSAIFASREDSLPLVGLEILDPWFNKIESLKYPFKFLLEKLCNDKFYVISHNNQIYLTTINQEAWEECIYRGKQILAIAADKYTTELDVKSMISTLLHDGGKELFAELWLEVTTNAHFSIDQNGNSILVSYGYGAEHIVEAILTDSIHPLHYSEICSLSLKKGKQLEIRRAHNAAAEIGLLFGRGTYGLQKHFPLNEVETKVLIAEVEFLIENGNQGKQWHCSGIFDEIEKLELDFSEKLTPYVINIALQQSSKLSSLNRMVWVSKSTNLKGASNRIDVHQAIVSIIRSEGRVMSSDEIRNHILKDRGLNYYFQIQPEGLLLRVGPGTWGLIDRDLPFNQIRVDGLINEMENLLRNKQTGIHITEVFKYVEINNDIVSESTNTSLLGSIFQKSPIIALDKSQYLYLRAWGDSRRVGIKSAIHKALSENLALSMNELLNVLPKYLDRTVDKMHVSYALRNLEARYNIEKNTWSLSNENDLEVSDIDI